MRIDAYNAVSSLYRTSQPAKTMSAAKVSSKDALYISETAKDFHSVRAAVASASDIREDRVADIRSRIQSGNYHVDADSFAEKLISKL